MDTLIKIFLGTLITISAIAVIGIVMVLPVWFLWNWLMPTIFNVAELTFWQALGMCFLSAALFKNNVTSK